MFDLCVLTRDRAFGRFVCLTAEKNRLSAVLSESTEDLPSASVFLFDLDTVDYTPVTGRVICVSYDRVKPEGVDCLFAFRPFREARLLALLGILREDTEDIPVLLPERRAALFCGREISLSAKEYDLLSLLLANGEGYLSPEDIRARVFPESRDTGTVNVYIHYLREKLGAHAILVKRGYGYAIARRKEDTPC